MLLVHWALLALAGALYAGYCWLQANLDLRLGRTNRWLLFGTLAGLSLFAVSFYKLVSEAVRLAIR